VATIYITERKRKQVLDRIEILLDLYKKGVLGGECMPEDSNPHLPKDSVENYVYFTLPMALNYQRNSYKLWDAAQQSYEDNEIRSIFNPLEAVRLSKDELCNKLIKEYLVSNKKKFPYLSGIKIMNYWLCVID
jgi:hypothetical protein